MSIACNNSASPRTLSRSFTTTRRCGSAITIPLAFGQEQQNWLHSLRFEDESTFKEIQHGKGRIFWAA